MSIYELFYNAHLRMGPEAQARHRAYYEQAHAKNIEANRKDLCIMTEKILSALDRADRDIDKPADLAYSQAKTAQEIIDGGNYLQAVALMDDDIREDLHLERAPCTHLEFLEAYMERHEQKYGKPFTI